MEAAKLCFLGDANLANGFRLAGFQVYPDADVATLEGLLRELQEQRQAAFVVLDHALADCGSRLLQEVREEGGRILLSQVPPLNQPVEIPSCVDQYINKMLGGVVEEQ